MLGNSTVIGDQIGPLPNCATGGDKVPVVHAGILVIVSILPRATGVAYGFTSLRFPSTPTT